MAPLLHRAAIRRQKIEITGQKYNGLITQGDHKERKKNPQHENIMVCPIPQGDHNQSHAGLTVDSSSGFQALVTSTLTLDGVTRHTVVIDLYLHTKFHRNRKNFFLDGLTACTPPSSRSCNTKSRTNMKNPAGPNQDIVLQLEELVVICQLPL